jgi:hypothetical protein
MGISLSIKPESRTLVVLDRISSGFAGGVTVEVVIVVAVVVAVAVEVDVAVVVATWVLVTVTGAGELHPTMRDNVTNKMTREIPTNVALFSFLEKKSTSIYTPCYYFLVLII